MREERLSDRLVYFRYVVPVVWVVVLVAVLASSFKATPAASVEQMLLMLLVPLLFAAIGGFVYWRFVWDLADVVVLSGDVLRVRRRGVEQRIPLADVVNVSATQWVNPKRITLRLRRAGVFGDEVAFSPRGRFQFNPFGRDPVAELLIARVDAARRKEMA